MKYNIGDKLHEFTILKIEKATHRNKKYTCLCNCGNTFIVTGCHLSKKKDCGCKSPTRLERTKKDLVGRRNGKLLAIKYLRTEKNRNIWLCKCDCGNLTEVTRGNYNYRTQSCGRCSGSLGGNSKYFEEIPGAYICRCKRGATDRNLEYNISNEYIWSIFLKQERKCALSKRAISFEDTTASLDRIDSKKGYIEGNVQWVHKDVNIIKNKYDENYLLEIINDIYTNNKDKILPIEVPSWTDYFLAIAKVVSLRSKDAQTKCGAVITDENNIILGTGYNSFPPSMPDDVIPNTRPEKYDWVIHAERMALLNCSQPLKSIKSPTLYVTGRPCFECLKYIISSGIKNIFAIEDKPSEKTMENEDKFNLYLLSSDVNLYTIKANFQFIKNFF